MRTREFDTDRTLEKAMTLFWEKGFEATSIQDLVEKTGVSRFGLYAEWGDKRGLFLAALDRYRDSVVRAALCDLEADGAGLLDVQAYFDRLIAASSRRIGRRGCLMTNSAIEQSPDAATTMRVRDHLERMERAFGRALEAERKRGRLRGEADPAELARFLTGVAQGLGVMLRAGASAASVAGAGRVALGVLAENRA